MCLSFANFQHILHQQKKFEIINFKWLNTELLELISVVSSDYRADIFFAASLLFMGLNFCFHWSISAAQWPGKCCCLVQSCLLHEILQSSLMIAIWFLLFKALKSHTMVVRHTKQVQSLLSIMLKLLFLAYIRFLI